MTEPTKLEFSSVITRYETTAVYKNSKDQQFLIKISGCSKSKVEESTKKLSVYFDLVEEEPQEVEQQDDFLMKEEENNNRLPDNELKLSTENFNLDTDLEIAIDPDLQSVKTPFKFKFIISDEVEQNLPDGEQIVYKINPSKPDIIERPTGRNKIIAIITVNNKSATFTILGAPKKDTPDHDWKPVSNSLFIAANNQPQTRRLEGKVGNNKHFKIKVKGEPGTQYTIKGDWDVN